MRVYGPYINNKQTGRKIVIVVDRNGKRRTVSFPKWLMELHLGRKLDPNECTVDHWNSNIDDNEISNLRLVPRDQHSADDTRRVKLIDFNCAWCDKPFSRSPRLIRDKAKHNKAGPFCSKRCSSSYGRAVQLKLIEKFPAQQHVPSEYYKRKYISASANYKIDYDDIDIDMLDILLQIN